MVKGLQKFREHFSDYRDSFVVIGGIACDEWLQQRGMPFRPTRDVDMYIRNGRDIQEYEVFAVTGDLSADYVGYLSSNSTNGIVVSALY